MVRWRLQDGDEVTTVDEDTLRERLRKGDLDGTELVRAPEADRWQALHDTGLFGEEVPHLGDPWTAARRRKVDGFLRHLAIWAVIAVAFWLAQGAFPSWAGWWAIGVGMHGIGVARPAWELLQGRSFAGPETQLPYQNDPPALQEGIPATSDFLEAVDASLQALREQLREHPDVEAPDLEALRASADDLDRRRAEVKALADPSLEERLREERDEVEAKLAAAGSEQSTEALESQREALDARLAAFAEARALAGRLYARQRTLLHDLEALRLELLKASLREAREPPPLSAEVDRLRREAAAHDEVDEVLARARRASRRPTS